MSPLARALTGLVTAYRRLLSPLLPPRCRFAPTCSAYALEALRVHGAGRGSWLALRRVARCHPFHPGGHDPVPPRVPAAVAAPGAVHGPGAVPTAGAGPAARARTGDTVLRHDGSGARPGTGLHALAGPPARVSRHDGPLGGPPGAGTAPVPRPGATRA